MALQDIVEDLRQNLKYEMVQNDITSHKQLEIASLLLQLDKVWPIFLSPLFEWTLCQRAWEVLRALIACL